MLLRVVVACACALGVSFGLRRGSCRRNRRARSSPANCSPTTALTARPASAASSPTVRWWARSGRPAAPTVRFATLPPGTIRVTSTAVCAHLARPADRALLQGAEDRLSQLPRLDFRFGFCLLRLPSAQPACRADQNAIRRVPRRRSAHRRRRSRPCGRRRNALSGGSSLQTRAGTAYRFRGNCPRPMVSIAATMRPSRPSSRSASDTMRMFGVAVGEARRSARAMLASSRCGLSAQTLA